MRRSLAAGRHVTLTDIFPSIFIVSLRDIPDINGLSTLKSDDSGKSDIYVRVV